MNIWIIIGTIFILVTLTGLFLKSAKKPPIGDKALPPNDEEIVAKEENDCKEIQEQIYFMNTHKIKYLLYQPDYLANRHLKKIHENVALNNLWINEPFYSEFFKVLLVLDSDVFFIKDPNSKIITASLRDDDNKIVKVKSYQVLSVIEMAAYVLEDTMSGILLNKKDIAQNAVLAIIIIALHKARYFVDLSTFDVSDLFLNDFADKNEVEYILALFDENHKSLKFVKNAFKNSMISLTTYPYVEREQESLKLLLPQKLPQKELQNI